MKFLRDKQVHVRIGASRVMSGDQMVLVWQENRDEVAQMHDSFCAVEGNAESHPCKMWAGKADRERRKKLRRRGGKPDFMEL